MRKKVAIVTIKSINYGNRLQNYAVYKFLKNLSIEVENIYIHDLSKKTMLQNHHGTSKTYLKLVIPMPLLKWNWKRKEMHRPQDILDKQKEKQFDTFTNSYMNRTEVVVYKGKDIKKYIDISEYDFFFAGSDQIWNPDFAGADFFFLDFAEPEQRIAFTASIGYEKLPDKTMKRYAKHWREMRYISVREDSAAELIKKATGKEVDVFLDPTMLLTKQEWEEISKKPKVRLPEKYIVCLFLGNTPDMAQALCDEMSEMETVILNDKAYPDYYTLGPSEFIYLIAHAQRVLTDSFHCTVFSILFHKPFWVFQRKSENLGNMFTRLENLLSKLYFEDRIWDRPGNKVHEICDERFEKADAVMDTERNRVQNIMEQVLEM